MAHTSEVHVEEIAENHLLSLKPQMKTNKLEKILTNLGGWGLHEKIHVKVLRIQHPLALPFGTLGFYHEKILLQTVTKNVQLIFEIKGKASFIPSKNVIKCSEKNKYYKVSNGEIEIPVKSESGKDVFLITWFEICSFLYKWLTIHPDYPAIGLVGDESNCQHFTRDFLHTFCGKDYKTQVCGIKEFSREAVKLGAKGTVTNFIGRQHGQNLGQIGKIRPTGAHC